MSIASEITRLQTAKSDLKTAIENKGVTVSSEALISDYADYVDEIEGGGSTDEKFEHYLNNTLTRVKIPDSVTSLHNYCFSHLTNLEEVDLNNVTSIGTNVFEFTGIKSIEFPATVTTILGDEFYNTPVETIVFKGPVTLGSSNSGNVFNSQYIKKIVFEGDVNYNSRDQYNNGILEKIKSAGPLNSGSDIEFTNDDIVGYFLANLKKLESITFNDGCQTIGAFGIYNNRRLKRLQLPATIDEILVYNFSYMYSLEYLEFLGTTPPSIWSNNNSMSFFDIVVPQSAVDAYKTAFPNYSNRIYGKEDYNGIYHTYSEARYSNQTGTTPFTQVNDTVLTSSSFSTSGLKRFIVGTEVTELGVNVFNNFENNGYEVFIPDDNNIETIGTNSLYGYTKPLVLPKLTAVSDSAMQYIKGTPVFSNALTSIGYNSFYYSELENFVIPDSVTSIGSSAFYNAKITGTFTVGKGLTSVASYNSFQFTTSSDIDKFIVRCETVPSYTISQNYTLKKIVLEDTVENIENYNFDRCYLLSVIISLNTVPPVVTNTGNVFTSLNALEHIYVPSVSLEDYKAATGWSKYANKIEAIPQDSEYYVE